MSWPIIEAILELTAAPAAFYSWLWLENLLQKNINQGLAVSD